MKVNEKTVRHVAKLARLNLTDKELKMMEKDMNSILESFKILNNAPDAEPSFQPMEMNNIMREDKPEKSLTQGEALANTNHKEKGFFKGPKAI